MNVRLIIYHDDLCSEAAKYLQILVVTCTFCATNFDDPHMITVIMSDCFCIQNKKKISLFNMFCFKSSHKWFHVSVFLCHKRSHVSKRPAFKIVYQS